MRWKGKGRRALSFLLALVLALSLLPASALAADTQSEDAIALVNSRYYTNVKDAVNAAKLGATIKMLSDWNLSERLVVESGMSLTIIMDGHTITRNRSSRTSDGEVIWVGKNATLELVGNDGGRDQKEYSSFDTKSWNVGGKGTHGDVEISDVGGLITGGWSTNGAGGIHMKEGARVTLDHVAVAGNRAEYNWGDGDGGGVMMDGANGELRLMNGAMISYNRANYGGGLYIDQENCNVSIENSHIDNNYSDNGGGGIYSYDLKTVINMTGGSTINYNSASDGGGIYFDYTQFLLKSSDATAEISHNKAREGYGGAIYMEHNRGALFIGDTNSGTVQGIKMESNQAEIRGGALFIEQENIVVSNCLIQSNRSNNFGGGIYINNDLDTISSSTITNNTAKTAGGGVYVDSMNDITFSGKVIVENNTRDSGQNRKDDVYPQNGATTYSNILGTPSGKSRIGIRTETAKEIYVGSTEHYFIESAFFSDFEDQGYIIKMVDKGLKQVMGTKTTTAVEKVPSPGITDSEKTYKGQPVSRGYFSYPSIEESTEDLDAVFYYSDGYFLNADPKEYDAHLATMSMAMAMAGFYSNIGNNGSLQEKEGDQFPSDRTYTYKSQNIEKLLNDIGVTADKIYISNSNSVKPGTDTIGVAIGQKTIGTSSILVPIAIRGAGYESEWYSNTTVGTSGEHAGFASAADQVFQQVQNYIRDYGLADAVSQGKVKFWIAGYSRAGATANLTAKRLIEAYCAGGSDASQNNQVYAYCFEAPKGGLNSAMKLDAEKYYSIHNCINKADVVPLVAPEEMGFIRYGVDHYVPGDPTTTSTPSVKNNVWKYVSNQAWAKATDKPYTTWYDNSSYTVGSDAYNTQREKMLTQLALVDPDNIHFYDQFNMGTINYLGSATGAYDLIGITPGNITQEEFGQVLMRSLLSWGLQEGADFRGGYTTSSPSFQQAMQTVTKLLFGKNAAQLEKMMNAASGTMDRLSTSQLMSVYKDMIGNWTTLSQSKRDDYLQMLWDVVIEGKTVEGEYVAMYLTPAEKAELRSAWNVLLDVLLRFAEVDYNNSSQNWNKSTTSDGTKTKTPILDGIRDTSGKGLSSETQAVLGTLAYNASALMQAHYPEINFAWLRSFDDFYTNETKHVEITTNKTPIVTSSISADGETWDTEKKGNYQGDQILKLTTDTPGAAIYYRLSTDGRYYGDWRPYNQPINLPAMEYNSSEVLVANYYVQTTAVYCDNVAAVTREVYSINQPTTYAVRVNNTLIGKFKAGDTVTINGTLEDSNQVFKGWKDPTIEQGSSSTAPTLTSNSDIVTTFTMPAGNVYVDADYATRISNPTLTVNMPEAGKDLPTTGELSWGSKSANEKATVSVYWLEQVGDKTQLASGRAKYGTKYSVAALVEQDVQNDLVFASTFAEDAVKVVYGMESGNAYQADVNAEGALRIFGNPVTTAQAKVMSVPEQNVSIVKGSTSEQLNALLPQTVTLTTEDGTVTAPLTYTDSELQKVTLNSATQQTYEIQGNIGYGELDVNPDSHTTATVKVTVYPTGVTAAPTPSEGESQKGEDGTLTKTVTLSSTTQNASISYKIGNASYTPYNDSITLTCPAGEKKTFVITAKAEATEMSPSSEVTFTYVLDNPFTVTINRRDTGTKGTLDTKTYTYHKNDTVTIAAPAEADERFEKWVATGDSGITIDNENATALTVNGITGDIELTAVYNPVVNQLDLTLPAPVIGEKLGNEVTTAKVMVTSEYDVTNLFNDIDWTPTLPTSGYPTYNTVYTAKLTLKDDANVKYFLKDGLKPSVNDDDENLSATVVKETNGEYAVYVTFPKTDKVALKSVVQPTDIYVQHGATYTLPTKTTLELADGSTREANVSCRITGPGYDSSNLNAQVLTATGTVEIPSDVQKGEVSDKVEVKVYVDAADQVAMPTSSLISGSYTGEQMLRLSCETEDATIYYTLDGSDPITDGTITGIKYDGGIITLPNSTAVTNLHVIAVKNEMRNSMMAMYRYDVTRRSSGGSSKPVNPPEDQPSAGGSDYKSCKHDSTCPLTKFTDLNANAWYHDGVHYCLDSGLMAGYGNALFGPNDKLSRAQVVTVLWRMAKSPAPTAENSFTDVPADTWYTDAVRWAAENGVVGGYGDGRFGPNDPVTREQMAAMFYRFAKQQGRDVTQRADLGTYADAASVSDWAKEALQWACGAGLINGMDGSLVPQGTATRAQTAAVLQRLSALTK